MEAIQKAIAKAKAKALQQSYNDKNSTHEQIKRSTDSSVMNPAKDEQLVDAIESESEKTSETDEDRQNISYKQTRIIDVNQRQLFKNRIHAASDNNLVANVFKMLRAQILSQMRVKELKTLAITSATEGVGKSLVSVNLAISLSLETNQTIMLVDLDLKHPSITNYFGIEKVVDKGIGDYLLNGAQLNEILINPGIERLVLLPGHKSYQDSPDIISSQKMFNLIDELKSRYQSRIIIFDLPPILATPDAFSLMPHFDSSLLVIEDGRNTRDELKSCIKMMNRTEFLGSVLNKGVIQQSSYY